MTDKEKIKTFAQKRLNENMYKAQTRGCLHTIAANEDIELISFIGSLPEEPVSEDLEKFATELANEYFPDEYNIWARPNYEARFLHDACIRTAKWQKEQMMKQLSHMPWDKAMDYIVKEAEK